MIIKIYYSLGFRVVSNTGRGAGSENKIRCLRFACENFEVNSYRIKWISNYFLNKLINTVDLLIRDLFKIFLNRKNIDFILIRDNILFPIFVAKLLGYKVISEVHAVPWEESSKSTSKKLFKELYKSLYLSKLNKSDGVIFNHSFLKDYYCLQHNINIPSLVSYNAGNFTKLPREKIRNDTDKINFVYSGNIYPWHGVDQLLSIFDAYHKIADFHFYLVGSTGSKYSECVQKRFAEKPYCSVVNVKDKVTLNQYIELADYCILPVANTRTSPGNPIKLYDYLTFGKRIITQSNCLGYSDIVEELNVGICIDIKNPDKAISQLCSSILTKSTYNLEVGVINRCKIQNSWEYRMQQWCSFFKTLGEMK